MILAHWLGLATAAAVDFDDHELGEFYALWEVDAVEILRAGDAIVDLGHATGFAVAPRLVLTNHHVALALGDTPVGRMSRTGKPIPLRLVAQDPVQDVALYRSGVDLHYLRTRIAELPQRGEAVAVLGHPGGAPLRVSFGQILTERAPIDGVMLAEYSAQTWWGSSGSAVVDRRGRAVAVHWGWDADGAYNGRLTGIPLAWAAAALPELTEALLAVGD
ncbi:MAG: serine protease [Myxococcales bacterium]|nr:serine protease [Myxococcales bacterium]